mmetsp:Transcript_25824/g.60548  ORF Transcript_25824/g.60548 Transcript_25824/m.60548 type:complete len:184 (-) Transcript_25824:905-1456(-)
MFTTIHRKLRMFSAYQSLLFLVIVTKVISNAETSTSYVSVQTLDHYGNAIQLSHAKEATQRYGRPVIVAVVDVCIQEDSTADASTVRREDVQQQREAQVIEEKRSRTSFVMAVSLGKSPILHPIRLPLQMRGKNSSPFVAMCFTGVKGDALWLLQKNTKVRCCRVGTLRYGCVARACFSSCRC